MATRFFQDMLASIAERGRALVERSVSRGPADEAERPQPVAKAPERIEDLCRALLSGRGEASGVALARQIVERYARLSPEARIEFFRLLARDFGPDQSRLRTVWASYDQAPTPANLQALMRAVEPPRQELFRASIWPRGEPARSSA